MKLVAHDARFRAKVMEAFESCQPQIPRKDIERRLVAWRAAAQANGA